MGFTDIEAQIQAYKIDANRDNRRTDREIVWIGGEDSEDAQELERLRVRDINANGGNVQIKYFGEIRLPGHHQIPISHYFVFGKMDSNERFGPTDFKGRQIFDVYG